MFYKRLFFIFIFLVIFLFLASFANAAVDPEKNPICWYHDDCQKKFKDAFPDEPFVEGYNFQPGVPANSCTAPLGVCLPAKKMTAQIKIGENVVFENIGDYIKKLYLYLIYIGGIVSAAIIMFGGFLYVTAGGSADRANDAKKYIGGSITGLSLLLSAYAILYIINPYLVDLAVPPVFMLRPIVTAGGWCQDVAPPSTKVAFAGGFKSSGSVPAAGWKIDPSPNITDPAIISDLFSKGVLPVCGLKYFFKDSGENTCDGNFCPPSSDGTTQICVLKSPNKNGCLPAMLAGTITSPSVKYPFVNSTLSLMAFCKTSVPSSMSSSKHYIEKIADAKIVEIEAGLKQQYTFSPYVSYGSDLIKKCPAGQMGYFLAAEVNQSSFKASVTASRGRAIGKIGSGKCGNNLFDLVGVSDGSIQLGKDIPFVDPTFETSFDVLKSYLFTPEDLKKGTNCDIEL